MSNPNNGDSSPENPSIQAIPSEGEGSSGVQKGTQKRTGELLDDERIDVMVDNLGLINPSELGIINTILEMAMSGDVGVLKEIQERALVKFFRSAQLTPTMKDYKRLFALLPEMGANELLKELGISLPSRKTLLKIQMRSEWVANKDKEAMLGQNIVDWFAGWEFNTRQLVASLENKKGITIENDINYTENMGEIAARIFEEMMEEGSAGWGDSFESFCEYLLREQASGFQINLSHILPVLQKERERIKEKIQRSGGSAQEILDDHRDMISEYNEKVLEIGHSELAITEKDVKNWVKEGRSVRGG